MYFKDNPTTVFVEKPAFEVPSTWTPPIRDVELEFYLSEIEDKLLSINESCKSYLVLSRDERRVLHCSRNDEEIAIGPANNGSPFAVWSRKDFLMEASSQLNHTTVHEKCQSALLQKVNKEIKDILRDMLTEF